MDVHSDFSSSGFFAAETRDLAVGKCFVNYEVFIAFGLRSPNNIWSSIEDRPSCLITRGCLPASLIQFTINPLSIILNSGP